jgi:hypothetical protein
VDWALALWICGGGSLGKLYRFYEVCECVLIIALLKLLIVSVDQRTRTVRRTSPMNTWCVLRLPANPHLSKYCPCLVTSCEVSLHPRQRLDNGVLLNYEQFSPRRFNLHLSSRRGSDRPRALLRGGILGLAWQRTQCRPAFTLFCNQRRQDFASFLIF